MNSTALVLSSMPTAGPMVNYRYRINREIQQIQSTVRDIEVATPIVELDRANDDEGDIFNSNGFTNRRKLAALVSDFFARLFEQFQDTIFNQWTRWAPHPSNGASNARSFAKTSTSEQVIDTHSDRGIATSGVMSIEYLFDTILYEPIQFGVYGDHYIEFFDSRPTMRIDSSILGADFKERYLDYMTSDAQYKHFFDARIFEPVYHKKNFQQFRFNDVLAQNFDRTLIVQKLVMKSLLRSCYVPDGGTCFRDCQRILLGVFQNMSLRTERLYNSSSSSNSNSDGSSNYHISYFIQDMCAYICQPNLWTALSQRMSTHFK